MAGLDEGPDRHNGCPAGKVLQPPATSTLGCSQPGSISPIPASNLFGLQSLTGFLNPGQNVVLEASTQHSMREGSGSQVALERKKKCPCISEGLLPWSQASALSRVSVGSTQGLTEGLKNTGWRQSPASVAYKGQRGAVPGVQEQHHVLGSAGLTYDLTI